MLRFLLVALFLTAVLACGSDDDAGPTPSPTPSPTVAALSPTLKPTLRPTPHTPTPSPVPATPSPTPVPATPAPLPVPSGAARIIGTGVQAHSEPASYSAVTRSLPDGTAVTPTEIVYGQNWVVGDQALYAADQGWQDKWYRLAEGDYVYYAWVYVQFEGETQPWDVPAAGRWVDVDTTAQTLTAGAGDTTFFHAAITSGKPSTETPAGSWAVYTRIENETMQSNNLADSYYVENVLYTQYIIGGIALHLNYWQPNEVFGGYTTSHGCVGLKIHDAQWMWLFGSLDMPVTVR